MKVHIKTESYRPYVHLQKQLAENSKKKIIATGLSVETDAESLCLSWIQSIDSAQTGIVSFCEEFHVNHTTQNGQLH